MTLLHIIESGGGTIEFLSQFAEHSKFKQIFVCGERAYNDWNTIVLQRYNGKTPSHIQVIYWPHAYREINLLEDVKAYLSLKKIVSSLHFQGCIVHSSKAGFLGRLLFRHHMRSSAVIYVPHGFSFLRKDIKNLNKYLFIKLEKFAASLSGHIICTSKSELNSLQGIGLKGDFINNGTNISSLSEIERAETDGRITIITVGRLTEQKSPGLFNDIAGKFLGETNIQFLWIGDGELKNQITSANIRTIGPVPKSDVIGYLKKADIYLSTAQWEGLPFAVLEAMSMSLPLVLSDCVGNQDLIVEHKNGFLFQDVEQAVEKIKRLVQDKELRKEMGKNSYTIVADSYNSKTMIAQYEHFIESHLAGSAKQI